MCGHIPMASHPPTGPKLLDSCDLRWLRASSASDGLSHLLRLGLSHNSFSLCFHYLIIDLKMSFFKTQKVYFTLNALQNAPGNLTSFIFSRLNFTAFSPCFHGLDVSAGKQGGRQASVLMATIKKILLVKGKEKASERGSM